jgi:phage/plasmid-associated DNA primase
MDRVPQSVSRITIHPPGLVTRTISAKEVFLETANDPLHAFLDACCELHPLAWCRISELGRTYEQWTASYQKRVPLSRRAFAEQLKMRGCRADRTNRERIWRGIRLVKKDR